MERATREKADNDGGADLTDTAESCRRRRCSRCTAATNARERELMRERAREECMQCPSHFSGGGTTTTTADEAHEHCTSSTTALKGLCGIGGGGGVVVEANQQQQHSSQLSFSTVVVVYLCVSADRRTTASEEAHGVDEDDDDGLADTQATAVADQPDQTEDRQCARTRTVFTDRVCSCLLLLACVSLCR